MRATTDLGTWLLRLVGGPVHLEPAQNHRGLGAPWTPGGRAATIFEMYVAKATIKHMIKKSAPVAGARGSEYALRRTGGPLGEKTQWSLRDSV